MVNRYQLLVFDWHGTLLDSCHHIADAMQATITDMNWPLMSPKQLHELIGHSMFEILQSIHPDCSTDERNEFIDRYRHHFLAGKHRADLFPGVLDALNDLKQQGYYLAIATSDSRSKVDNMVEKRGIKHLFDEIRCGDEAPPKPHPQMLEDIMIALNVSPARCLMLGDTENDMQMAINAKTDAIAVDCGIHDTERLLRCNPIACLKSVAELPTFLAKLEWDKA